jgi:hypothetical protein
MKTRTLVSLATFYILVGSLVIAKDFWENPFDKWSVKDVQKMMSDSPWASTSTTSNVSLQRQETGGGERETFYKFTARFFSSLPIREAYVRLSRIGNNYDSMTAEQKQKYDAQFNKPLTLDFSDKIVVALDFRSDPNDANFTRDLKNYLDTATAATLKQNVYLITKTNGRIELIEYYAPGKMLPAGTFVFPRMIDGKPVVNATDKDLRFEIEWLPVVNKVYFDFKPQKMTYKGQFSF